MRILFHPGRLALAFVAISLVGCATPGPIRDVAEQGAATVALAERALRNYVTITNAQLTARMELVRQDSLFLSADRARRDLDRQLAQSAGLAADDEAETIIRNLAEQRRTIRDKESANRERIVAASKLDTSALAQVPTDKLNDAKKRFVVLAQKLTPAEWIGLVAGYAEEIAKGIDGFGKNEKEPAQP